MIYKYFVLLITTWLLSISNMALADSTTTLPINLERPWRIGYVESGIYNEYPTTLLAIAKGLEKLGWINLPENIPANIKAETLWQLLAKEGSGQYIQFVENAYWRPGNFDSDRRSPMRNSIVERIKLQKDLDLIIAMGTWAGQDMRAIGPPIPTVVASVSDAISSGIANSAHDSGRKNLHVRVEPHLYQRQLRLFHEIAPFKNLGIVYEDSETGITYAALSDIKTLSKQLNFNITPCHAESSNINKSQAEENAINCYAELATQSVDAVYITTHRGVNPDSIGTISKILRNANIPTFSMAGARDVHKGILLSLADSDALSVGLFHAQAIARILNGATPRDLNQVWIDNAKIALNLTTARTIGFDPPIDILLAADEVIN